MITNTLMEKLVDIKDYKIFNIIEYVKMVKLEMS